MEETEEQGLERLEKNALEAEKQYRDALKKSKTNTLQKLIKDIGVEVGKCYNVFYDGKLKSTYTDECYIKIKEIKTNESCEGIDLYGLVLINNSSEISLSKGTLFEFIDDIDFRRVYEEITLREFNEIFEKTIYELKNEI